MFPTVNYIWKCNQCGKDYPVYNDDEGSPFSSPTLRCLECDGEMTGSPLMHRGPFPENPYRRE